MASRGHDAAPVWHPPVDDFNLKPATLTVGVKESLSIGEANSGSHVHEDANYDEKKYQGFQKHSSNWRQKQREY